MAAMTPPPDSAWLVLGALKLVQPPKRQSTPYVDLLTAILLAVRILGVATCTHPCWRVRSLMWRQLLFSHRFIFPTRWCRECDGSLWHQTTSSWDAYDWKGWSCCLSKALVLLFLTISFRPSTYYCLQETASAGMVSVGTGNLWPWIKFRYHWR